MGVNIICISLLSTRKKIQIDKAKEKVFLSDNYQVNLTARC